MVELGIGVVGDFLVDECDVVVIVSDGDEGFPVRISGATGGASLACALGPCKGLRSLFLSPPVLSFLVRVFVRLEETGSGS